MRINCTIDETPYSLNVNANKPLSRILEENIESFTANSKCLGANCGNCLVILNGSCTFSCLIPAFKLNDAVILTYEGFSKSRNCHDIEKAYEESGIKPCRQCYASKTILIEAMLQKIENSKHKSKNTLIRKNETVVTKDFIEKELAINACKCLDVTQIIRILNLARQYRRKRSGKA